jgi:hypothetical protein
VAVVGGDGETHRTEVTASSVFDAVDQAMNEWARLWWFSPGSVFEVRAGERCWRERARREGEAVAARVSKRNEGRPGLFRASGLSGPVVNDLPLRHRGGDFPNHRRGQCG